MNPPSGPVTPTGPVLTCCAHAHLSTSRIKPHGAHDRRKPADRRVHLLPDCVASSLQETMFTLQCASCALSCQLRSSAGCSQRRIACVISPRARQLEASLIRVVNDRDPGVVCEYAMEKGPTEPRAQGPCVPVPRSHLTLPETGNTGTATRGTRVPENPGPSLPACPKARAVTCIGTTAAS